MSHAVHIVSPDDQKVTFVELFFDLVFVYCVTQVAALLHGHVDVPSAASALLVFWLVWWGWTQFTWALNAANTDHPHVQALTLVATAVAFFMGVGIPQAFAGGAVWFAGPYVALRAVGLLLYYWVARSDREQRRAVRTFSLLSVTGLAAVIGGALAGGSALPALWAGAIALDLMAAGVGGRQEGWNLHPEHFAERHGLIVIIALGETLIGAAAGFAGAPRTPVLLATGALAVGVTGGLWWTYFRHARQTLEHALASRSGSARSSLARDIFSIIHFPMLCGVIGMAVAMEAALAHPDHRLDTGLRVALGTGAALFVTGTAAAVWRAAGRPLLWRWILAPGAAALVAVVGAAPWLAMGLLLAMLLGVAVAEHRAPSAEPHLEAGSPAGR